MQCTQPGILLHCWGGTYVWPTSKAQSLVLTWRGYLAWGGLMDHIDMMMEELLKEVATDPGLAQKIIIAKLLFTQQVLNVDGKYTRKVHHFSAATRNTSKITTLKNYTSLYTSTRITGLQVSSISKIELLALVSSNQSVYTMYSLDSRRLT